MNIVLTVTALIAALAAVLFALHAHKAASRCETHANRLRGALGTIKGHDGAIDSLTQQLQKLRGQFHAFKAQHEHAELPPVETYAPELRRHEPASFCANYGQAQIEGPLSPAAQCECGYCEEMRERRRAFRAAEVPRTVVAPKANAGE